MTLRIHPDEIVKTSRSPLLGVHSSWSRVRLSEVADVLNGFAFKSASFSKTEGFPLIRIRDVGRPSTETKYTGSYDETYVVQPGEVVVGMDGDFRAARWEGPPALLNQRVCKVIIRNSLMEPAFLFFALPGYLDAVHAHTSAITVKHLSSRTVQDLPLPLPPLAEQRRIVAAIEEQFSRLDAAERSVREARRRLATLGSLVYSQAVQDGDAGVLGDLLDGIEAGKSFKCDERPAQANEWGVIKVSAMTWGSFDPSQNKTVIEPRHIDARWEIRPNDLLLSRANTSELVGAAVLVGECRPKLLLSDKSMRLLVKPNIDKAWLRFALGSREIRSQMSEVATGTSDSMRNISQQKVRELRLRVPVYEDQRRIVAEVEQQFSLIDSLRAAVESAQKRSAALRRGILERAFGGELVPQDPADEPASVLLERIRAERAAAPVRRRTRV